MARYLDPKNDLPFKRIFGEHPDLLKSFLTLTAMGRAPSLHALRTSVTSIRIYLGMKNK
jgi:hypothetical protein